MLQKMYVFKQETSFIKILQKYADVLNQFIFHLAENKKKIN